MNTRERIKFRPVHAYGYVRVSTREQNEDRQRLAMEALPIPEKNIYMDKQSGKDFQRPQYKRLLRRLKRDIPSPSWGSQIDLWKCCLLRLKCGAVG